jgi:Family of unknown function (DUF6134)
MRFVFMALALLFTAPAAQAATSAGRLEFNVTRNGEAFGTHTIVVTAEGGDLVVRNTARLRASVGPVMVFRFDHACTERWRQGALQGLECSTREGGETSAVRATRTADGLRVTGPEGAATFAADALPTTWWTRSVLSRSRLIDAETGQAMAIRVSTVGSETMTVGGQRIATTRYRVQGTVTMDIWYDGAGRWVRAAFTARGQDIEYNLVSPLSAAPL